MSPEIYRKRGRAIRYERGLYIRSAEAGEAVEQGEAFHARPIEDVGEMPNVGRAEVESVVGDITALVRPPLRIERLIVSHGVAEHEFGSESWSDESRRVHLSVANGFARMLVDLGDFDLDDLPRLVDAFTRCRSDRRAPSRLRLAPSVTAALLPSLVGTAIPGVALRQTPRGRDGKGAAVEDVAITAPPWPNWYRPSYRVRPVRVPLHLAAERRAEVSSAPRLPVAVALLAPPDGLTLRVLCVDGDSTFAATVRVAAVHAIGPPSRWYPYGGGAFGAEMVV